MSTEKKPLVVIVGPTAVGKTALSIALAKAFDAEIISGDSMQVYRGMDIGTAKITPEEMQGVPHHMLDILDPDEPFNALTFKERAQQTIDDILSRGHLPMVVGGTGLYFKALTEGLSPIPPVPDAVRAAFRERADGLETAALHEELGRRDPAMAQRLRPSDRLRIMRALEVILATGRSLADFQGERVPGVLSGVPLLRLFVDPGREAVRARIDARFHAMMEQGALDEVARLRERRLDPLLPVMRAHGVPGLIAHLDGLIPLDEAVARGQADTRAYAKRQVTWFRHQMPGWEAVRPEEALELALRRLDGR